MAKPFGDISRILAPLSEIIDKLKERRALPEDQKRSVEAEIELIEGELARLNGGHGRAKKGERAEPGKRGRGKRVRRTRDQVEAHAGQIVEFIREQGQGGRQRQGDQGEVRCGVAHRAGVLETVRAGRQDQDGRKEGGDALSGVDRTDIT
jgi:hypothetical protein